MPTKSTKFKAQPSFENDSEVDIGEPGRKTCLWPWGHGFEYVPPLTAYIAAPTSLAHCSPNSSLNIVWGLSPKAVMIVFFKKELCPVFGNSKFQPFLERTQLENLTAKPFTPHYTFSVDSWVPTLAMDVKPNCLTKGIITKSTFLCIKKRYNTRHLWKAS